MIFSNNIISDVAIFQPDIFEDDRGYFYESYNQKAFSSLGIENIFVQDNQSYSKYGTIRGLHFQEKEYAQAKLVKVVVGCILDIILDLRPHSKSFGKHIAIELSAENKKSVFVPRGCAHGFSVLSEEAIVQYKCDNFYHKESENGIIYSDPDLNINWQIPEQDVILSKKDRNWAKFQDYLKNI